MPYKSLRRQVSISDARARDKDSVTKAVSGEWTHRPHCNKGGGCGVLTTLPEACGETAGQLSAAWPFLCIPPLSHRSLDSSLPPVKNPWPLAKHS